MFSKNKFLVTGGAGYIGTHTVWALAEAGASIVILDNLSNGHPEYLPPETVLYQGDVGDSNLIETILKEHSIEGIIHFAASIEAGLSVQTPLFYYQNNVAQSIALLKNIFEDQKLNIPILFSSTAAVYGNHSEGPLTEEDTIAPINPYGESKRMMEIILQETSKRYGCPVGIFRYFNAAGADPKQRCGELHQPETHLIPLALQTALGKREAISIYGTDYPTPDGTCVRDYIHVSDLAQAHVLGMNYLIHQKKSFLLNLGNGQGYSVREILNAVQSVTKASFKIQEEMRRPGDPAVLVSSAQKASRLLAWEPQWTNISDMITHAFLFYKRT